MGRGSGLAWVVSYGLPESRGSWRCLARSPSGTSWTRTTTAIPASFGGSAEGLTGEVFTPELYLAR